MVTENTEPILMPFGKYEGEPISLVPTDYLKFMLYKINYGPHIHIVAEELQRRKSADNPQ
jgi:hypothetical protein